MRPRVFQIGGRRWRWVYRKMRTAFGLCDYGRREITIDSSASHHGQARLDTEIHEALHALQAFATEEHTTAVANTLSEILYGLGYRLTDPVEGRGYIGK